MKKYLSIDIGGTNLKYALIDEKGHILEKDRVKTDAKNLTAFMENMYEVIDSYQDQFEGIAICAPGKIDTENKIIYFGGALKFLDGLNLQDALGDKYNVPISVENDGKAAALSEQWLGELRGVDTGVAITLGTGVGGGVVVNNHLLHGWTFQAGELSWMITNSGIGTKNKAAYTGDNCSAVNITRANITDRDGAIALVTLNLEQFKLVRTMMVDSGYTGQNFANEISSLTSAKVIVVK